MRHVLFLSVIGLASVLTGCGGSSTPSTGGNYTIGGTISGLNVSSVVLATGTETVTVSPGATTWTFPTAEASGTVYSVVIQTQPVGESCEIPSGGSGSLTGNVSNVTVTCSTALWTWDGGSSSINASGVYGTPGAALAGNMPGGRYDSSSWTDSSGNLWLFGGVGYDSTGGLGKLNDLWQYSPSSGLWTWVSGAELRNASAVYGTQGTASAGNLPGARQGASSWTDSSGNLWLFGGFGYNSSGSGDLNDLWRYAPSTGEWTWAGGGSGDNASGVYGTLGTASATTLPGGRYDAVSWIDSSGDLWLFGGYGYDSTGAVGNLDDLWKYTPSTGLWTWVSGLDVRNAAGVYGTQGTAASGNYPGARQGAISWIDSSGNLWLFGGYGYDANALGSLNDLWKFNPSTGQWTWVSGVDGDDSDGVYGTLGATGGYPGARQEAISWIDSAGDLWLFGGYGYDSIGNVGDLDDLWQFTPSSGLWTWVSGGNEVDTSGVYGTQGVGLAGNVPGARQAANAWIISGNLWLFGGVGYAAAGNGYLSDLWQFVPP